MVHRIYQLESDMISILSKYAQQINRGTDNCKVYLDVAFSSISLAATALADLSEYNLEVSSSFWTFGTLHMPDIVEVLFEISSGFRVNNPTSFSRIKKVIVTMQQEGALTALTDELFNFVETICKKNYKTTNICLHITSTDKTGIYLSGTGQIDNSIGPFHVNVPKQFTQLSDYTSIDNAIQQLTTYLLGGSCQSDACASLYSLYKSLFLIREIYAMKALPTNRIKLAKTLLYN